MSNHHCDHSPTTSGVSMGQCERKALPGMTACYEHANRGALALMIRQQAREIERLNRMISGVAEAYDSLDSILALAPRDWSLNKRDAWLWAVICGWPDDDEESGCDNGSAMEEVAAKWGWSKETITRLQKLHAAFRKLPPHKDKP